MWGRGTKYNDGKPEVNASSIGLAKAALEVRLDFYLSYYEEIHRFKMYYWLCPLPLWNYLFDINTRS